MIRCSSEMMLGNIDNPLPPRRLGTLCLEASMCCLALPLPCSIVNITLGLLFRDEAVMLLVIGFAITSWIVGDFEGSF